MSKHSTNDQYRLVTTTIKAVRPASIVVQLKNRPGTNIIARSLLFGIDDFKIGQMRPELFPLEHTFRVFAWKAEELGLA
jgi:hypothetical protein